MGKMGNSNPKFWMEFVLLIGGTQIISVFDQVQK
jgi:hypothetical protein